jgi:hypothetical protein
MGHTMSAQKPPPQLTRCGVAVGRRAILVVPEGLEAPSTRSARIQTAQHTPPGCRLSCFIIPALGFRYASRV